jgi:formylmethanofuran dehydrogenase subunit E
MAGCQLSEDQIQKAVDFHGHWCPGLAIGLRAGEYVLGRLGFSEDEELVAVVETDMCAVDGIQSLTGCTFGKGNLIHRDYGKNAFTFVRRSDGKAIRIAARPDAWGSPDPEREALLKRVREGKASEADRQRVQRLRQERLEAILAAPVGQLFEVQAVEPAVPERARLYESVTCAGCGEQVMETRVRLLRGQPYCVPCFETRERRL